MSGKYQSTIQLLKTWGLDHIKPVPGKVMKTNRFAVSETGAVGISCGQRPSLSVMYPNTDKPPVVLSDKVIYYSATFVNVSGKEYLAASGQENGCLYLWDIESKTPKKAFDPNLPKIHNYMNICKIDESTIGYGEVYASFDESRRVFILRTDTEEAFTLSKTLKLFTPDAIRDMCHTEISGGKTCLLLCLPEAHQIMAVEMIGGKTRWEAGKQQMGEGFKPWSICTDQNDGAYVADFGQEKVHLLSATDGTVIKRFDVGSSYGLKYVFNVRFHDQHLYVQNKIHSGVEVYVIVKFKPIKSS